MNEGSFILINGKFYSSEEPLFGTKVVHEPSIVEQFRWVRSVMPFFDATLDLISLKLKVLNIPAPHLIAQGGKELKRQIERCIVKNKHFTGSVVTFLLTADRYCISSAKIEPAEYTLNRTGLLLDLFDKIAKPSGELSMLSTGSQPYWQIVNNYRRQYGADELILCNHRQALLEVPGSNLFLVKNQCVVTPSLQAGVFADVLRPHILQMIEQLSIQLNQTDDLFMKDLLEADEVFVADAVRGIRWVMGFREKRYYSRLSKKLSELLLRQTDPKEHS